MGKTRQRAERYEPTPWAEVELHRVRGERDAAIQDIRAIRRKADRQMRDRVGTALLDGLRPSEIER